MPYNLFRHHIVAGLIALLPALARAEPVVLTFASYAKERPSEEMRKLQPFQQLLEDRLKIHGIEAQIDVRIYPTYEQGIAAIADNQADFSRLGPASYIAAKARNPGLQILAVEASGGTKKFFGLIVVGKDSPIRKLSELKGKRFAFGDLQSTTGRYLSQAEMVRQGIHANDLAGMAYLGRHDKVAFAVANGSYDGGAINERTYKKHGKERGLRVIARFPSPTEPWVAREGLDPAVVTALRKALLDLKGEALEYIDRNGFLPGSDADYDALRKQMQAAQAFAN